MSYSHIPVLLNEVLENLRIKTDGIYVDATFGRGGHSLKILQKLGNNGRLYAFDRDLEAVRAASAISDPRFSITHCNFSQMLKVCTDLSIAGKVDGILMDIGVSSPQLDDPNRGFSFQNDGPLDMRMDQSAKIDAAYLVNHLSKNELAYIFKVYGEERFAAKAAAAIVREREKSSFATTGELALLLEKSIPGKNVPKHKATRCFQALRIAVNSELDELRQALSDSIEVLSAHGRLCVISFHSLEDRIVKNFIKDESRGQAIPNGLPLTFAQTEKMRLATATLEPVGGAIRASQEELDHNVRSRSATLRVCERLERL